MLKYLLAACLTVITLKASAVYQGEIVEQGAFPYIVSIQNIHHKVPSARAHACGGTLISPQHV